MNTVRGCVMPIVVGSTAFPSASASRNRGPAPSLVQLAPMLRGSATILHITATQLANNAPQRGAMT